MKKILMILAIAFAVIISVGAVSADDGWSFNWSSSSNSTSDGGQLDVNNNEVNIQDIKFVIPDEFKHNESADAVGEEAGDNFPGCDISIVRFDNGDDSVIIKVVYGDIKFDKDSYTPSNESVAQKIDKIDGFFKEYDDGVSFDYCKDGKLVEIFAPNQETLAKVIQSSE